MITIGKAIHYILTNDSTVGSLMDTDNIFPVVIPEERDAIIFPSVVYERTSINTLYTTCGSLRDVNVTITIYATTYPTVVDLADAIVGAMEGSTGEISGTTVSDVQLINAVEGFSDVYSETLIFNIK